MTKAEAIEMLNKWGVLLPSEASEALDLAIEALSAEVVRCKDCRHRHTEGDNTHYYWCFLHDRPVDDTDFCAWAYERKGGDDE